MMSFGITIVHDPFASFVDHQITEFERFGCTPWHQSRHVDRPVRSIPLELTPAEDVMTFKIPRRDIMSSETMARLEIVDGVNGESFGAGWSSRTRSSPA